MPPPGKSLKLGALRLNLGVFQFKFQVQIPMRIPIKQ